MTLQAVSNITDSQAFRFLGLLKDLRPVIYEHLPKPITVELKPGELRGPRSVMSRIYLVSTRYPSALLSTWEHAKEEAQLIFEKGTRANPIQIIQSLQARHDSAFAMKLSCLRIQNDCQFVRASSGKHGALVQAEI